MCLSIIAGVVAKLYDDLEDNIYLEWFKEPTVMETLKWLHYITDVSIGIVCPLMFYSFIYV